MMCSIWNWIPGGSSSNVNVINGIIEVCHKQACPIIALKVNKQTKHEINPDVLFVTTCTGISYYVTWLTTSIM